MKWSPGLGALKPAGEGKGPRLAQGGSLWRWSPGWGALRPARDVQTPRLGDWSPVSQPQSAPGGGFWALVPALGVRGGPRRLQLVQGAEPVSLVPWSRPRPQRRLSRALLSVLQHSRSTGWKNKKVGISAARWYGRLRGAKTDVWVQAPCQMVPPSPIYGRLSAQGPPGGGPPVAALGTRPGRGRHPAWVILAPTASAKVLQAGVLGPWRRPWGSAVVRGGSSSCGTPSRSVWYQPRVKRSLLARARAF